MMPAQFDLARVTIRFTSPMVVGAASTADLDDISCVTDANGLPAIPGTSIAGALRHAVALQHSGESDSDPVCCRLFGFQRAGARSHDEAGQVSRLTVSWAHIHDSQDRPVPASGVALESDPVLRWLAAGAVRDHVRLDHRGVVDGAGKFDERLVPAGARFTFELMLDRSHAEPTPDLAGSDGLPEIDELVALLAGSGFRLGGRSRRGLGEFVVERWATRRFDLREPADRLAFEALSADLSLPVPHDVLKPAGLPVAIELLGARSAVLSLEPEDFVLVGDGLPFASDEIGDDTSRYDHVDRFPYREHRVVWSETGQGSISERPELVIPATGIKGALRHRAAFHAHARLGRYADDGVEGWHSEVSALIAELFGAEPGDGDPVAGKVLISDVRREDFQHGLLSHVSLDRFTRGPLDGALFGEAPAWGRRRGAWELRVQIRDWSEVSGPAQEALTLALADLCAGRLAIGSGANRGHGYLLGEINWLDPERQDDGGDA